MAEYCDDRVCLSVSQFVCLSVREHVSGITCPIFTKFGMWPWLGRFLATLRYVMYFRYYGYRHVCEQAASGEREVVAGITGKELAVDSIVYAYATLHCSELIYWPTGMPLSSVFIC